MAAVWRWLSEPSPQIEPEQRLQARLLMVILLVLITLGVVSLILSLSGLYETAPKTSLSDFDWITLGALVLFACEYALSRTRNVHLAIWPAVISVFGATFWAISLNPGDLRSLYFLAVPGLVASLFLSALSTANIFLFTIIAMSTLGFFSPAFSIVNNTGAFFFLLLVGTLVTMAVIIRQSYLEKIHLQTRQLIDSEARLREMSIRDPLTGLFNRRYLEELLGLEMIRAMRKGYPIGMIMLDIDNFKKYNDLHGHAAGDAVLVQLGSFLRSKVRASDVTCRYGGEEFILILPEASLEKTQLRAEQICAQATRLQFNYQERVLEPVTLSVGVAVFPAHGATQEVLLKAVDNALYRAKAAGRDRVVVAEIP